MTRPISAIHTPCKQCAFAQYDNKTQTGCHLGYIEIYKNNNEEIIEAYDEESEFFVINNKKCIGYRENAWFEKREVNIDSMEDKLAKYQESNYAHYIAVIDLKKLDMNQLHDICKNLMSCQVKPQKIILIRYKDENKKFAYKDIEDTFKNTNICCSWRIQTILDEDMPYQYILYDIVKNNKSLRFLLTTGSNDDFNTIINYANNRVYSELKNFCVCGNESKTTLLYSSTVLRHAFETGKDLINDPQLYEII